MQALLIAQDPDEVAVLCLVLQRAGLIVTRTDDLAPILQTGPEKSVDLILLAPQESPSPDQIQHLRAQTQIPLLVIAGQMEEEIHVKCLERGADLVIQRPFSARLLIAQIRALLRRAAGAPFFTLPTLSVGDLTLDPAARTVKIANQSPRRLTHLEFRLLYTLMIHQGQVLPSETLVEHVWEYTGEGDRDLVRGLVSRLRAKIEPNPGSPTYIITVPGVGYSLNPQE